MVAAARRGTPLRPIARRFGVALSTVQVWVARAGDRRLDRVDWADRPDGPRQPAHRSPHDLEDLVLTLRGDLKDASDLGDFGAAAIHRALQARGLEALPAVRTIGRLLERRGAGDGRRRGRRPPPPVGGDLPDGAARRAALDRCDVVAGWVIQGGTPVAVLNGLAGHGGLAVSWPLAVVTATAATEALVAPWRAVGLPTSAPFDNDTIFQGPHPYADVVGRVMRLCLSLEVIPGFAPPRETGSQAAIENFHGRWQAQVGTRFTPESLEGWQAQSGKCIAASRRRAAARIEAAPRRRPFPPGWRLHLQAHPRGRILFLRRTGEQGAVEVLGHRFEVDVTWPHRLIRAEVDRDAEHIRFVALRRREPTHQPLLREITYKLPRRRFHE
jgi:hypothetical protein